LPLVVLIFWIGLYPNRMLRDMTPAVERFEVEYTAKLRAGDDNPTGRGMLKGEFVGRGELAAAGGAK